MLGQIEQRCILVLVVALCGAGCGKSDRGEPKNRGEPKKRAAAPVAKLAAELSNTKLELSKREQALEGLVKLGPRAIAALKRALKHEDGVVRYHAAEALGDIGARPGTHKKRVLAALRPALSDRQFVVRQTAAEALGKLGPAAIQALGQALRDTDPDVRRAAGAALIKQGGRGTPVLVRALRSGQGRLGALLSLLYPRHEAPEVPVVPVAAVAAGLGDRSVDARVASAELLGRMRKGAPQLTRALEDDVTEVCVAAARALERSAPKQAAVALPTLINQLQHDSHQRRGAAASTLNHLGPLARSAAPQLLRLLDDPEQAVRRTAAYALGGVGDDDPKIVRKLIETVRTDRSETAAINALGDLKARAAVPILIRVVREPQRRSEVVTALGRIGDRRGIPALVWALRHHTVEQEPGRPRSISYEVGDALARLGPPAVPALRRLLRDKDSDVVDAAKNALSEIEETSKKRENREK